MLRGTKLYSILTGNCPVCQRESMYKEKNAYRLSKIFEMHEHCSHCHTKYKIEPSFFYGAMYVSYAVGIAFAFAAFMLSYFLFKGSLLVSFLAIVCTLIFCMPIIMRLSRNIWINIFLHFDKLR